MSDVNFVFVLIPKSILKNLVKLRDVNQFYPKLTFFQNLFIYVPVICGLWHYFQPKSDEDYVARQLASMYYRGYLEHIASDICDQRFDDFERKNPWEKKFSVRAIHILLTRSCTFPKVPIVETKEYWDEEWAKKFETKTKKIKYVANIDTEVDMSVFPDPSNQLPNRIEQIVRFFKSCFVNTFNTFLFSERL